MTSLDELKVEINKEEGLTMEETRVRFPYAENVAHGSDIKAYLVLCEKKPEKQMYVCFREDGEILDRKMEIRKV